MPDHIDLVKDLLRQFRRSKESAEERNDQKAAKLFEERMGAMEALLTEVLRLRQLTKPIPASYGDLSDLPPELVKELTGIKVDDLEEQLFTIINSGDEADLDAILIELFRRFGVVQTRKFLQNKLWRMAQKEVIYSVPRRKGVYSATKPADDDDSPFDDVLGGPSLPTHPAGGFDDGLDDEIPF